MANTFDWVEIRARDIETATNFYKSVFDWKMDHHETVQGSDYWIFDTGNQPRTENIRRGGIWLRPAGEGLGVVVYIVVENIEAVLEKVIAYGGKAIAPKVAEGAAFRAYFEDPDGNLFGLWEEKENA
jgi:predicted enzyme related to lactoylglutathione lyase